MKTAEALIFVPRAEDYEVLGDLGVLGQFTNFRVRAVATGPGAINTAAAVGAEAARPGPAPAFIIGAGLCGSLDIRLKAGEAVVSDAALLGDWLMEDGQMRTFGLYGGSSYKPLTPAHSDALAIKGQSPFVEELLRKLCVKGFQRGRLLSTDTYVTGPSAKLERGRLWGCLAADHESGALAQAAMTRLPGVPWLNLRIVADTIGEQMGAEGRAVNLVETLALKLLVLLSTLDANFPKCDCESCGGLGCPGYIK